LPDSGGDGVGIFPDAEPTIDAAPAFFYRRAVLSSKESWLLKLYVSGTGRLSRNARTNLERICQQNIRGHYHIEVIDLQVNPALAREHEIVAVPTVVREAPVPIRKVVGDLSSTPRALFALQF
jgi:circadian clock protein KaiB